MDILVTAILVIVGLLLQYYLFKIAVYKATKKALEQSEYYLEIMAKEVFERQKTKNDKG